MLDILNHYDPITLDEMSGIKLMNRTDTKFVTNEAMLRRLLINAADEYYVQEVEGRRMSSYYTLYFDTDRCDMFLAHHNGKLNRQKLRIRSYMDVGLDFLEVKTKNNHGRTKKKRIAIDTFDHVHTGSLSAVCGYGSEFPDNNIGYAGFVSTYLGYDPQNMSSKIENRFKRITLVNKGKTERLTIDLNISFRNIVAGGRKTLNNVVIIELKRDGLVYSPILEKLLDLRIKPMGFSKYCMGMAMTDGSLKHNRFMKRMTRINKIIHS